VLLAPINQIKRCRIPEDPPVFFITFSYKITQFCVYKKMTSNPIL